MKVVLKVKESFNLNDLEHYGFRKQDYLIKYGRKEETGCNVWRLDDTYEIIKYDDGDEEEGYIYYYGINIFEETPKHGYYAPHHVNDDSCAKPRIVYMMDNNCSYMEHTQFEFNPVLYDLIVDGVIEKVVQDEKQGT